jgi:putative addiction module component (TIGR02574 family)
MMEPGGNAMTTLTQELIERTLELSSTDREKLARRLIESLEPKEIERAAWRDELRRRAELVASGRYTALSLEEVNAEVHRSVEEARRG